MLLILILLLVVFGPKMLLWLGFWWLTFWAIEKYWPWDFHGNPRKKSIVITRNKRPWEG